MEIEKWAKEFHNILLCYKRLYFNYIKGKD